MLTHVEEHSIHQQLSTEHPLCARPNNMLECWHQAYKALTCRILSDQCLCLGDRPACADHFLYPPLLGAIGSM